MQNNVKRYVLVSVNPKAGRKSPQERSERLATALRRKGFGVEIHTDLDVVSQRANDLFEQGVLQALTAVGGDGTVAELTNRTVPGVPLTLLPSGTANLIAKYLKLPFNPEKVAEVIGSGKTISFDVGRANGRLFLVMVSAGIDADIVSGVHAAREHSFKLNRKKGAHISYLSYVKPIFNSIVSYKYPRITTEILDESEPVSITGKWSFVFNLPRYGWGLPLVPKCVGVDQKLDFCIFQSGKLGMALLDVFSAQLGSLHRFLPNTKLGQASRFRISLDSSESEFEVPFQLDGDPGGCLPVEIEIIPNRFTVLASAKVVDKLERARKKQAAQTSPRI